MKTKVRNAEGKVLDYLVAKAKGCEIYHDKLLNDFWISENPPTTGELASWKTLGMLSFQNSWARSGPIISGENISRTINHSGLWIAYWTEGYTEGDEGKKWMHCDRSELVAGLRCFVQSRLGSEVEVPDELAQ